MKYKHVIWDWNGTLLNDVCLAIECMNNMLGKRNMVLINREKYREIVNLPIKDYYKKLGFDFAKEAFENLCYEFLKEFDSRIMECDLHKNCIKILSIIKENGILQSVLSAANVKTLKESLKRYKITDYFDYIIGQDDHFAGSKIDKGLALIENLGIDPSRVLLIGDLTHDYEVAKAIKCDVILVSNGHHSENRLKGCCTSVVNDLDKLKDMLF